MSFFVKLEKKFGKFAIRNLPIKIAVVMAISYILWAFVPTFAVKLVFSPYAIMEQHQFWRLFTWVFSPPGDLNLVGILMIFILILFGQQIEQAMGTFMFNLYYFFFLPQTTAFASSKHFLTRIIFRFSSVLSQVICASHRFRHVHILIRHTAFPSFHVYYMQIFMTYHGRRSAYRSACPPRRTSSRTLS